MTKVMIADDNMDILESTQLLLETMGYEVVTTGNADDIRSVLAKERPDLLLQDVNMPRLQLKEHVAAVKSDPNLDGMPVVLFTASVLDNSLPVRVGADGIVYKPFDAAKIKEQIDRFVARRARA